MRYISRSARPIYSVSYTFLRNQHISTMGDYSFENVNLGNLKFRLPEKPNTHEGWMCNIYDADRSQVTFSTPVVKIPFKVKFGNLTVFEDYDADVEPETGDPEYPTKFSQFIQNIYDVCYASFDQMREDKAKQGILWANGVTKDASYPIVMRKSNYSEVTEKTYTSMKYNFKVFKDNKTQTYDTFLCHDSFNQACTLEPRAGLRGRMFLLLHSWYFDEIRSKFTARIYVKGIQLEPTHDAGKDIREWMTPPKPAF